MDTAATDLDPGNAGQREAVAATFVCFKECFKLPLLAPEPQEANRRTELRLKTSQCQDLGFQIACRKTTGDAMGKLKHRFPAPPCSPAVVASAGTPRHTVETLAQS